VYGPFTSGGSLREALKIIRRIFPFRDQYSSKKDNYEFYRQLGLTPEISPPAKGEWPSTAEGVNPLAKEKYQKTIRNIKLFFEGKKKQIVRELKKEMMMHAKRQEFELADEVKKTVFALEHINDIALMKSDFLDSHTMLSSSFRIEAYDIAHMSGKNMVGVMTVLVNGTPDKNEYRKFIIRSQSGSNDTGALEEVLSRRLRHTEWGMPDLIVIDGGVGQLNIAKQVLFRYQMKIPVVSVVKDDSHKAREILGDKENAERYPKEILLANSEAHRFAITFHKLKRSKNFLPK
jgi:excinuclease ABC subunit C